MFDIKKLAHSIHDIGFSVHANNNFHGQSLPPKWGNVGKLLVLINFD